MIGATDSEHFMAKQFGSKFKASGTNSGFTVFVPDREQTAQNDIHKKACKAKGWAKFQKKLEHYREYINAEHDYVLMRGDIDTGRNRTMLGSEARLLNQEYETKYWRSATPRLWRWKLVKPT
jgi:hypothetical protein